MSVGSRLSGRFRPRRPAASPMARLEIAEALQELEEHDECTECNLSWVRGIERDEAAMVSSRLCNLPADKAISVNLTRAQMTPPAAHIFAELTLVSDSIVEMNLEGNNLGSGEDRGSVLGMIKGSVGLRALNLAHNQLGGAEGIPHLAALLANNHGLRSLGLASNDLGAAATEVVAAVLQESCSLEELYLSGNPLGDEGAASLAAMLQRGSSLRELHLDGCCIEDEGAAEMAHAIHRGNSQLRVLRFCRNHIGSIGSTALAQLLVTGDADPKTAALGARSLEDLSLHQNPVGFEGFKALTDALRSPWSSLRCLDVGGIPNLSNAEVALITDAARVNHSLDSLEIHEHYEAAQSEIDAACERNRWLARLLPAYRRLAFAGCMHARLGARCATQRARMPWRHDCGGELHDAILAQPCLAVSGAPREPGFLLARFGAERQHDGVSSSPEDRWNVGDDRMELL